MSLSWRARRRWALVVLLVGLPVYIVLALRWSACSTGRLCWWSL